MLILDEIKKIFLPKNIWKPFTNRPIQQNYIFPSEDNINLYEVIETVVDDLNVGGNISVTDGTNTVTDATEIHLMGATVSGGSGSATITIGGGTGEANTASNVGTAGVGIYKTKTGVDLKFKKLNAGSNKVTITDDTGNDEIDIDVVPANFTSIPQSAVTNLTTDLAGKQPLDATLTGLSSLSSTQGFLYQTGTPDSFSIQSTIPTSLGGTGTAMTPSLGDMLVATGGGPYTFTPLAANSTGTKKFLSQTSSVASWSTLSVNDLSELSSAAQGSIAYKGASAWTVLTPGTSGQVLTTNGASADPSWANASGGATTLDGLTDVTITSPATGAVLYYNDSQWVNLAAGTTGQYLQGGTTPSWATPSGSATVLVTDTLANLSAAVTSLTLAIVTDEKTGGIFTKVTSAASTTNNGFLYAHQSGGSNRWARIVSDFVRPEWWGAVGDGTTDDTTAFQNMFDNNAYKSTIARITTGDISRQQLNYRILLSSNAAYSINQVYVARSSQLNSQYGSITIDGQGGKIFLRNGTNKAALILKNVSQTIIKNVYFYGTNTGTFDAINDHSAIYLDTTTGTGNSEIIIQDCWFTQFTNNCIRVNSIRYTGTREFYRSVSITNCRFLDCPFDSANRTQIQAAIVADRDGQYGTVENCYFYNVPRAFLMTDGGANWMLHGNTMGNMTADVTGTNADNWLGAISILHTTTSNTENHGKLVIANNIINHNDGPTLSSTTNQPMIYIKNKQTAWAGEYNQIIVLDHNHIMASSSAYSSPLVYIESTYSSFIGNNFQIKTPNAVTVDYPIVKLITTDGSNRGRARFIANTFINGTYAVSAVDCPNFYYDQSNYAVQQTVGELQLTGTSVRTYLPVSLGGTGLTTLGTAGQVLRVNAGANGLEYGTISGTGDFSSNTSTSVDSELVLFSGTGGKTGKRATGSGIAKLTSGVLSTVTAPSGALVGDTDTQTLTNKTVALGSNTVSGTTAQFNAALTDNDFATLAGTETLTNKTISGASNTINNLNASNLSSGTVPTARLGSGTADNTTYLRGDNTWATVSGGGSLTVKEEGSAVGTAGGITTIDFVGDNVTATGSTSTATVTVKGTDIVHLTSGTGNWTIPTGAKYIEVALIGAGGGGGNGAVGATAYGGLGGFSGNIVFFKSACVGTYVPGSTIPYSIGVGGTGGGGGATAPTNGTGTDTTFGLYTATGGAKGLNGTTSLASNPAASLNAPSTTTTNLFSTFLVLRNNLGGGNTSGGSNNLFLATLGSGGGMAGGSIVNSATVGTNTGYALTGGSLVGIIDPAVLGHPASAGSAGVTTNWPIICGLQTASGGRGGAANIGSAGGNGGAGVNGSGGGGGGASTTTAGTGGNGGNGRISILIHY